MVCKSAMSTAMTTATDVAINSTLPIGSVVHRFGDNCSLNGNSILLKGIGYYNVDASISLIPSAAGNVTVTLYDDGVAVPGATASATTTTTDDYVNLSIPTIIKLRCCNDSASLSFVLTGTASSVTNVSTVVTKL